MTRSSLLASCVGLYLPVALSSNLLAGWQDDIGYVRLKSELGASLPTGAGISVAQVEVSVGPTLLNYLPSTVTNPATGNYAGKMFNFVSGSGGGSWHAVAVADFFYGANTDPLLGSASIAPQTGNSPASIRMYLADAWLDTDFLNLGSNSRPIVEPASIANHAWIAYSPSDLTSVEAEEALMRFDYTIVRDDYVAVVGLNNGSGTTVPQILASSYNALSVGLTNGLHSSGTTPADVAGGGRTKPEIVVPQTATSWGTGTLSSCAAVLQDRASDISANAGKSETIRAVLLAGARKNPFPSWANTATRPLDTHYGTGEVNIWRSYHILDGGESDPSNSSFINLKGWDYNNSISAGGTATYFFTIPSACVLGEISIALVWDRKFSNLGGGNTWGTPTADLPDLNLQLLNATGFVATSEITASRSGSSGSVPHNLEHIWLKNLPAGNYAIRVTNTGIPNMATDYAIAWLIRPIAPQARIAPTVTATNLTLSCTALCPNHTYELQSSADLTSPWTTTDTFTPSTQSQIFVKTITPTRKLYRLKWAEEE